MRAASGGAPTRRTRSIFCGRVVGARQICALGCFRPRRFPFIHGPGPGVFQHRRGASVSDHNVIVLDMFRHHLTGDRPRRSYILGRLREKDGWLEGCHGQTRCGWVEVDADGLLRLQEDYPLAVRELAEQSAVSHNAITMIENRHRNVNPSAVRKLAAVLGAESRKLIREGGE